MNRRGDGVLVWRSKGCVDCSVKPFCTQNCAPFEWQCVIGTIGSHNAQLRATGSAQTEDEAIEKANRYAEALFNVYSLT